MDTREANDQEAEDMALDLSDVVAQVLGEDLLAEKLDTLPPVDPSKTDLKDLREWAAALVEMGNLTRERAERLMRLVERVLLEHESGA